MARVVPVGPIDPELYAFAKKEAEKAERNPRYVPKKRETPAHTVFYRRAGATVKAFVIDKIAPITFSSTNSAIPIRPSFLHLHPNLPEKNSSTASGKPNGWGFKDNLQFFDNFIEMAKTLESFMVLATSMASMVEAAKAYWNYESSQFPTEHVEYAQMAWSGNGDFWSDRKESSAQMSVTRRLGHAFTVASMSGVFDNAQTILSMYVNSVSTMAPLEVKTSAYYKTSYSYTASGAFLIKDIRMADKLFAADVAPSSMQCAAYDSESTRSVDSNARVAWTAITSGIQTSAGANVAVDKGVVAYDGSVIFPVLDINAKWTVDCEEWSNGTLQTIKGSDGREFHASTGITKNLGADRVCHRLIASEGVSSTITRYFTGVPYQEIESRLSPVLDKHLFVAASVGGFDGVLMWAGIYSAWPDGEKTQHAAESPIVRSNLAQFFGIAGGVYVGVDAPHLHPPDIVTEGICLPHAWFFCGANEALNRVFGANDYNHISVVVYPQGKHQFAVDEAEIFSVKLDHTPSFVARPGDTIELAMYAVHNGSPLVPYVVRGLVKELDEDGNPTDFYLAADGEISGTFEQSEEGHGTAKFKLSPHQKLDAYRLISVETTTTRQHGVQAHIEVLGPGARVPPGPPSITIESLHPTVLAGQESAFYITATHMANGSRIKYEIRSAGSVVSSGFVNIAYGAGVILYIAPYRAGYVEGTNTARYALFDPIQSSGGTQPSSRGFEIRLIHENAPGPIAFTVKYAHENYAKSSDRPEPLPLPELFYLGAKVAHASSGDVLITVSDRQPLVHRVWCSIKTKRVYVTFWDGKSCEVSNILKKNPESGKYEFNPDWKEVPFDYPPAVDPFEIKGALEPYVYAYMDYEASLTGE